MQGLNTVPASNSSGTYHDDAPLQRPECLVASAPYDNTTTTITCRFSQIRETLGDFVVARHASGKHSRTYHIGSGSDHIAVVGLKTLRYRATNVTASLELQNHALHQVQAIKIALFAAGKRGDRN